MYIYVRKIFIRHFRNSICDHSIHQYYQHAGYSDTFNRIGHEEPGTNSDFSFLDFLIKYLLTPFNNRYLVCLPNS